MKVHLVKTPEYEQAKFNEIISVLRSFEGPIEFIPSIYEFDVNDFDFLRYDLYPDHRFNIPEPTFKIKFDPTRFTPLSWRELFSLCNFYREIFQIEETSFVILLTKRINSLNWFSAYDESRNTFVHCADWEQFTEVDPKYPIAYQVVENIMSILMEVDISNIPNKYVHEPVKGCMNDFCLNKSQIIIKLQTANICNDCRQRISEKQIDFNILTQVLNIFQGIRNEVVFHALSSLPEAPQPIVVSQENKIFLPNQGIEFRLTPLFKTLYLFFLSRPDGVTLASLCEYRDELLQIYLRLRPNVAKEDAIKRIAELSHPSGDSFNPTKSHINKTINDLIQEPLSEFYRISGSAGNPYFIAIPRNLVDIRF